MITQLQMFSFFVLVQDVSDSHYLPILGVSIATEPALGMKGGKQLNRVATIRGRAIALQQKTSLTIRLAFTEYGNGGTRTHNQTIKSRLLCQLSYVPRRKLRELNLLIHLILNSIHDSKTLKKLFDFFCMSIDGLFILNSRQPLLALRLSRRI